MSRGYVREDQKITGLHNLYELAQPVLFGDVRLFRFRPQKGKFAAASSICCPAPTPAEWPSRPMGMSKNAPHGLPPSDRIPEKMRIARIPCIVFCRICPQPR
jgi:hypothetical protein